MALVSTAFRDWWDNFDRPQRFLDKQFGLDLSTANLTKLLPMPPLTKPFQDYLKPWQDLMEEVKTEEKKGNDQKYEIVVEVKQFEPHEIMVKTVDNFIVIEARHEEKRNEHGYFSKMFLKRYVLPEEYDISKVTSHLSADGILTIVAPILTNSNS